MNSRELIRMRLRTFSIGLCAGLLLSQWTLAAEPLPQRWVSAGGSLSEWVVVLGGEARLVGVDTTSQHPLSLKALPSVGYQRQLSAEGVLALRPDLLLGSEDMGPPPVLEQLEAAGVRIELLSAQADLSTLQTNLTRLGALLGAEQRAAEVLADYRKQLESQQRWVAAAQKTQAAPTVLFLLGHAGSNPQAAGRDTSAAWLVERAGGRNLATHRGYKALSAEALAALDPEVLVFADRRLHSEEAIRALLKQNPALAATRAARNGRLLMLDSTLLVGGLGPRLPTGLATLSAGFYPAAHTLTQAQP